MKNTGDGRRKIRVEREVQQLISQYIISNLKNDLPGLVTVSRIQMPSDFRAAQIFVTYYDVDSTEKINVAKVLQSWASDIQDEIAHKLKMRYCPKLTFFLDEATERILKIEQLISNLAPGEKVLADDEELIEEDFDDEQEDH